jgi:hypothetical protein
MNNQFINVFLLLFIVNIIGLYIYQQYHNPNEKKILNVDINNVLKDAEYVHLNCNTLKADPNCHLDREAKRKLGPVHNFHQKFNQQLYNLDTKYQQKNADPLGWRKRYILKNNKYLVPNDTNFNGTVTRNFLNQLENTDNIYRKGCN